MIARQKDVYPDPLTAINDGRPAGRSAERSAGRPGGARVVRGG